MNLAFRLLLVCKSSYVPLLVSACAAPSGHLDHSLHTPAAALPQTPCQARVCLLAFLCPKANLDGLARLSTACRTLQTAQQLSAGIKNAQPTTLDVNDAQALDAAVAQHDLVISLIPYTFHAKVIQSAIRQKKHVVTTSYVSPAMLELDAAAKEAGITVMNEIGLDPGSKQLPDIM